MNYYNPYIYSIPIEESTSLTNKLSFSSILNGANKTLSVINQAIPIIKQATPIIKNAKIFFNILNEFTNNEKDINIPNQHTDYDNQTNLQFFV